MTTSSEHRNGGNDVRGFTAPGFEGLRDALAAAYGLDTRGGGAIAAFHDGRQVAELAVGVSSGSTPRSASTSQVVFSCTKGVVATALLILLDRGQLDLDAPMARYWPEFGEHGKGDTTVRHVVSHMSGQPAFRASVSAEALADDAFVESVVASDEPWWPTGTAIAYQSISYGALCGGLIRRIAGESVGSFVQREIAAPLGVEFWIGIGEEREADVAPLEPIPVEEQVEAGDDPAQQAQVGNPRVLHHPGAGIWNTRAYHAGEIPGAGGIGTSTGIARMYACLANGGTLDGVQLVRPETIELGRTMISQGPEAFNGDPMSFGVGYMLGMAAARDYDPGEFGHSGYGGQASGAWPGYRASFAYLTTALRSGTVADARVELVLDALHDALERTA
jgi:CubicO group peptidase (beta-lactamase class C family)